MNISIFYGFFFFFLYELLVSVSIVYNFLFYLENEKDEKSNPTNEETKKDGGANP